MYVIFIYKVLFNHSLARHLGFHFLEAKTYCIIYLGIWWALTVAQSRLGMGFIVTHVYDVFTCHFTFSFSLPSFHVC